MDTINLFNEIESCSQFQFFNGIGHDPEVGGMMWGRACAWAAKGIREVLPGPSPRIGLPGLLTYAIDQSASTESRSWEASKAHLRSLVKYYVAELLADGTLRTDELPHYLQCLDVHWYHSGNGDEWHIGFMVCDMAELLEVVEEGLGEGLSDYGLLGSEVEDTVAAVMPSFEIRVSESGSSALIAPRSLPAGFTEPEIYQAFEVWRRIGGGLASCARAVGWHSWMAGLSSAYSGFGVREDTLPVSSDASTSEQRPSWYAYRRLAELLGNVGRGRMLLPDVASRDQLLQAVQGAAAADIVPVVVFEYDLTGPGLFGYTYLVLRDPTVGYTGDLYVYPRWRALGGWARRHAMEPDRYEVQTTGSASDLPWTEAFYPSAASFPVGTPVLLCAGDMPLVITSTARIDWTAVSRLTPGSSRARGSAVLAALLERPAWMDDPLAPLPRLRQG